MLASGRLRDGSSQLRKVKPRDFQGRTLKVFLSVILLKEKCVFPRGILNPVLLGF